MERPDYVVLDKFIGTVADFRLHLEAQRVNWESRLLVKIREGKS